MVAQPLYMGNLALASYDEPTSAPEGYMTSDVFWERVDNNIIKRCKEYGLL